MPDKETVSKEELTGYHKGSLNTLIAERNELLRIVQITEQLIQAHIKELDSLGVKITTSKGNSTESQKSENTKSA